MRRGEKRTYAMVKDRCRAWYKRTIEARRAYSKAYTASHKEEKHRYDRLRRPRRRQQIWEAKMFRTYGVSREVFDEMLVESCGRCDCCGVAFSGRGGSVSREPFVDHDHKTNAVRGLLCHRCNAALGLLHDNRDKIIALLDYVDLYATPTTNPKEAA